MGCTVYKALSRCFYLLNINHIFFTLLLTKVIDFLPSREICLQCENQITELGIALDRQTFMLNICLYYFVKDIQGLSLMGLLFQSQQAEHSQSMLSENQTNETMSKHNLNLVAPFHSVSRHEILV